MVADVIASGAGTIKGIYEVFTGLNAIAKEMGKAEVIEKLIEAQSLFLDLQQQQIALVEENRQLREQNRELTESQEVSSRVFPRHNAYWQETSDGRFDGPFSMTDWDRNHTLVRLIADIQLMEKEKLVVQFRHDNGSCICVPADYVDKQTRVELSDIPLSDRLRKDAPRAYPAVVE